MFSVSGMISGNKSVRVSVVDGEGNITASNICNPPSGNYTFSVNDGEKVVLNEIDLEQQVGMKNIDKQLGGAAADQVIDSSKIDS